MQTDCVMQMPMRPLGRTGWNSSILTLGGVKWDYLCTESEAVHLIQRAVELGVNTFDTAHGYGEGKSERRLGLALRDYRDRVFISTKTDKRGYDDACFQIEESLKRLGMDRVDLVFMHALDDDADYARIMGPNSVLKALDEFRAGGRIRYIGVSGHWYRKNMVRLLEEYPLDAVLCPVGLFNLAYDYPYTDDVLPLARKKGMAVMGMKVFGAGRVKHAASIEPYLRYSLNLPIDTAVIGCDSIAQLEEMVGVVTRQPLAPLTNHEIADLLPECRRITQSWDQGEFNWVSHYLR